MWDVKYKSWKTKKAKFGVTLCEFNWGTFGLGFEWHYTKNRVTTLYGNFAHLVLHFLWVEIILTAECGPHKARMDKMLQDLRRKNAKSTNSS